MAAAPADRLQDHYLATLDITTLKHLNLYNQYTVGLSDSNRYDPTRSNWNEFYQELEDTVFTFGFKSSVLIVTTRYGGHKPTELNNIISSMV